MIELNKKSFGKQHAKSFVIGQNFNYQLLINDHLKLKIFGNNTMNTKKRKGDLIIIWGLVTLSKGHQSTVICSNYFLH